MGSAISEVFPFAVGVAISPIPIIAVILVLFSARARVNGPAFLLGWVVGVAVVSVAVYYLADAGDTPLKAVGLALLLSAVNPKNLALSLAAGASLAQAGASGGEAVVGLVLFIVVAASTIGGPVAIYLFGGDPAARMLESWKEWLAAHNAAVMAVLLLVFGVDLFSQGLRGLSA
jgi:Sap, sulfolipid-1-addressing protein